MFSEPRRKPLYYGDVLSARGRAIAALVAQVIAIVQIRAVGGSECIVFGERPPEASPLFCASKAAALVVSTGETMVVIEPRKVYAHPIGVRLVKGL